MKKMVLVRTLGHEAVRKAHKRDEGNYQRQIIIKYSAITNTENKMNFLMNIKMNFYRLMPMVISIWPATFDFIWALFSNYVVENFGSPSVVTIFGSTPAAETLTTTTESERTLSSRRQMNAVRPKRHDDFESKKRRMLVEMKALTEKVSKRADQTRIILERCRKELVHCERKVSKLQEESTRLKSSILEELEEESWKLNSLSRDAPVLTETFETVFEEASALPELPNCIPDSECYEPIEGEATQQLRSMPDETIERRMRDAFSDTNEDLHSCCGTNSHRSEPVGLMPETTAESPPLISDASEIPPTPVGSSVNWIMKEWNKSRYPNFREKAVAAVDKLKRAVGKIVQKVSSDYKVMVMLIRYRYSNGAGDPEVTQEPAKNKLAVATYLKEKLGRLREQTLFLRNRLAVLTREMIKISKMHKRINTKEKSN